MTVDDVKDGIRTTYAQFLEEFCQAKEKGAPTDYLHGKLWGIEILALQLFGESWVRENLTDVMPGGPVRNPWTTVTDE